MSNKQAPRASEEELSQIHAGFAKWCLMILQGVPLQDKDGCAVLKEDGTPWLVPPSAAHMSTIRQFLKDNGIDGVPKTGTPLGNLASLPVFGNDEGLPPNLNAH